METRHATILRFAVDGLPVEMEMETEIGVNPIGGQQQLLAAQQVAWGMAKIGAKDAQAAGKT